MRNYISHQGTITFFENGQMTPEQVPGGASVFVRPNKGWDKIPQIRGDFDTTPMEQIWAQLKDVEVE